MCSYLEMIVLQSDMGGPCNHDLERTLKDSETASSHGQVKPSTLNSCRVSVVWLLHQRV